MRRGLGVAVLVVGLLVVGCKGKKRQVVAPVVPAEIAEPIKRATVMVRGIGGGGAGVVVMNEASGQFIVTNEHFVRTGSSFEAVYNANTADEWRGPATVVAKNELQDLALLKTAGPPQRPTPLEGIAGTPVKTALIAAGFPSGVNLEAGAPGVTVSRATIASIRRGTFGDVELVQLEDALHDGNSGGPVTTEKGQLVGISVAAPGSNVSFIVPWEHVGELLAGRSFDARLTPNGRCVPERCEGQLEITVRDPLGRTTAIEARLVDPSVDLPERFTGDAIGLPVGTASRKGGEVLRTTLAVSMDQISKRFLQVGFMSGINMRWSAPISLEPFIDERSLPSKNATTGAIEAPSRPIHIVDATLGGICGSPRGNRTENLVTQCEGKPSCAYVIDPTVLGDPAPKCTKDWHAFFTCGADSRQLDVYVKAEAMRKTATLDCNIPLRIIEATYGGSCGARAGNVTGFVRAECEGTTNCRFIVDPILLGDATPGCGKDLVVAYACGEQTRLKEKSLPADAGTGSVLALECP